VAERRSLDPPSGGRSARSLCGCYPPEPVPVQRAPRGPVRSAGMLMPKAARERFAIPPAGTALAPLPRCASGAGPLRERDSVENVTEVVTYVNEKETLYIPPEATWNAGRRFTVWLAPRRYSFVAIFPYSSLGSSDARAPPAISPFGAGRL
jgi:hypothetical protein